MEEMEEIEVEMAISDYLRLYRVFRFEEKISTK